MRPLVSLESGRNFAGFNLDEYKDAKTRYTCNAAAIMGADMAGLTRRKLDNIKRMQQRQQDQRLLDSRQLRSQRIEALQHLRTQASQQSIEVSQLSGR